MVNDTAAKANRPRSMGSTRFETARRTSVRALSADVGSVVYAARLSDGTIKIGYTADIYKRMAKLGGMSAILALKPGGLDEEQAIHRTLTEYRAHGHEYYHPVPEVLAVVNEMRMAYGMSPIEN